MKAPQSHADGDTRRSVLQKAATLGSVSVTGPAIMEVAAADTVSGDVEIDYTATVSTNTGGSITVAEDTTGDGTADTTTTISLSDGSNTEALESLTATTDGNADLKVQIDLTTSDTSVTPEVDSVKLRVPEPTTTTTTTTEEEPTPGSPGDVGDNAYLTMWRDYRTFVAGLVLAFAGVGLWSRSLTLGAWSGYLAFLIIAFATGTTIFMNIAFVTLVLVFVGMAFKVVRMEFGDDNA
jgi:hypothetical protein